MKWERARCARQVMREVDMERQARGIVLVCGPWGLSLCCAPWAKFARVAAREKTSRVYVPAGSHFQFNAKDPSLHIPWSARSCFRVAIDAEGMVVCS